MGFVLFVLLGLLGVMLLVAFGLSSRFSGQARILQAGEESLVARYLLESYSNDLLRQVRQRMNRPDDDLGREFRRLLDPEPGATDGGAAVGPANAGGQSIPLSPSFYRPSGALGRLAAELDADLLPDLTALQLVGIRPLPWPPAAIVHREANPEKRGWLRIKVGVRWHGRRHTLTVTHPFTVVMRNLPILRRFLLFCDHLHLEQPDPFTAADRINLLPIRDNRQVDAVRDGVPLTLWPTPGFESEPARNGAVFLGADDRRVILNLVGGRGDASGPGRDLADLWQISPTAFGIVGAANASDAFQEQEMFRDRDQKPVKMLGMRIPLGASGHFANLGLLGFSQELAEPRSRLLGGLWQLEDFLRTDPALARLRRDPDRLTVAAALRLHGPNFRADLPDFHGFPRDIYGQVFARFVLFSFFSFPSGGTPIPYSDQPNPSLTFSQYGNAQQISFRPRVGEYVNYMSRIVSGGLPGPAGADVPINVDQDGQHRLLTAADLAPVDGLVIANRFDRFAAGWLPPPVPVAGDRPAVAPATVLGRVGRWFRDQHDFKRACGLAGADPVGTGAGGMNPTAAGPVRIAGVVYVDGRLDLPEGIASADIDGGIVLVRGPITLGNVGRGHRQPAVEPTVRQVLAGLRADQVITFVSLTGETITLTGDTYLGVHLVSLRPGATRAVAALEPTRGGRFCFAGALAVSTLDLGRLTRRLGFVNDPTHPYVTYAPCLADDRAPCAVQLADRVDSYGFDTL